VLKQSPEYRYDTEQDAYSIDTQFAVRCHDTEQDAYSIDTQFAVRCHDTEQNAYSIDTQFAVRWPLNTWHHEWTQLHAEHLFDCTCARSVIAEAPTGEAHPEGDRLGSGCGYMSGQRIGALGPIFFPRREPSSQPGDQESGG
jgi:hypothetical protein